jgi:hypothetical protein
VNTDHAVRLELIENCTYQGDKRQTFPYYVHWTCPRCGAEGEESVDYLSYPNMGRLAKPYELPLSCEGEDDEGEYYLCWQGHVPVRMEVYAEVVGELTEHK